MKKALFFIFIPFIFISCTSNKADIGGKLLFGKMELVVNIDDDSAVSEIAYMTGTLSAESLDDSIAIDFQDIEFPIYKNISNLPIDDLITINVTAYDLGDSELANEVITFSLSDGTVKTIEIILDIQSVGGEETCSDFDGDRFKDKACGGSDCDDLDPTINLFGIEVCDNDIDEDCNGMDLACDCANKDGDFYQDASCGGYDCNDDDIMINPAMAEDCEDGIDNDCDEFIDYDDTDDCTTEEPAEGCCEDVGVTHCFPSIDAPTQYQTCSASLECEQDSDQGTLSPLAECVCTEADCVSCECTDRGCLCLYADTTEEETDFWWGVTDYEFDGETWVADEILDINEAEALDLGWEWDSITYEDIGLGSETTSDFLGIGGGIGTGTGLGMGPVLP